jgi:hypothetical protein
MTQEVGVTDAVNTGKGRNLPQKSVLIKVKVKFPLCLCTTPRRYVMGFRIKHVNFHFLQTFSRFYKPSLFEKLIWKPKFHYRVHKSPSLDPVLRLLNPVRTLKPYFLKMHFNITLPSTSRPPRCSFPFRFSNY